MNLAALSPEQSRAWWDEYESCIRKRMEPTRASFWANHAANLCRRSRQIPDGVEEKSASGRRCPPLPLNADELARTALAEGRRVFSEQYETEERARVDLLVLAFAMTALAAVWGRRNSAAMLAPLAAKYNPLIKYLGKSTLNNYVYSFGQEHPAEARRATDYGVRLAKGNYEREESAT